MSLTPYMFRSPSIVSFLRDMDSVFEDVGSNGSALLPAMRCDVQETKDSLTIHADLPGVPKEAINLEINKNVLTIQASREEKTEDESQTHHIRERRYGKISRSFQLPAQVQLDNPECSYENGALTIAFKKTPEPSARKLAIK